jgi:hypothetical protein
MSHFGCGLGVLFPGAHFKGGNINEISIMVLDIISDNYWSSECILDVVMDDFTMGPVKYSILLQNVVFHYETKNIKNFMF